MSSFPLIGLFWTRLARLPFAPFFFIKGLKLSNFARRKFTSWVKAFIPQALDRRLQKNLNLAAENFEEWGYSPNLDVDDNTYLAAFLATWLSGRVFGDSSTSIRPETFWVACNMVLGRRYNLAVPYLAWAYNRLGTFKAAKGQISQTCGPWALIAGWLGCYFSQAHSSITRATCFTPFSTRGCLPARRLMW